MDEGNNVLVAYGCLKNSAAKLLSAGFQRHTTGSSPVDCSNFNRFIKIKFWCRSQNCSHGIFSVIHGFLL